MSLHESLHAVSLDLHSALPVALCNAQPVTLQSAHGGSLMALQGRLRSGALQALQAHPTDMHARL